MAIIFEEHKSRMGGKHLMSDEPFAVIRESGEIYLSGDYTIEEIRAILEAAEHSVQADGAYCVCPQSLIPVVGNAPAECPYCHQPRRKRKPLARSVHLKGDYGTGKSNS